MGGFRGRKAVGFPFEDHMEFQELAYEACEHAPHRLIQIHGRPLQRFDRVHRYIPDQKAFGILGTSGTRNPCWRDRHR